MANNIVNANEDVLRHIVAIHFDQSSKTVKPSAFEVNKLKTGLSVSIKSKLDKNTKNSLISQLQKKGGGYQCDLEAKCLDIINITYNNNNAFNIFETPQSNNNSHADIKFHSAIKNEKRSKLKKLRKELMDKFR